MTDPQPASVPRPPLSGRACLDCRHHDPTQGGRCRCQGVPIPWLDAIADAGPCPAGAPRWEPR